MIGEKSKNSAKRTDVFDGVWAEAECMLSIDPGSRLNPSCRC